MTGQPAATISSNNVVLNGVVSWGRGERETFDQRLHGELCECGRGQRALVVTVSGLTLTGAGATNYTLAQPAGLSANITAAGVAITSGITANNKVYDGTPVATISSNNVVLNGVVGGDTVNVSLSTNGYSGELYQPECRHGHRGDGERADADGRQCDQLHADAAGGINGQHFTGNPDSQRR